MYLRLEQYNYNEITSYKKKFITRKVCTNFFFFLGILLGVPA